MPMGKLTIAGVRNAKPGRHADGDGLYLLVKPSGARSWLLRIQYQGRRRDIGLGSVDVAPRIDGVELGNVPIMLRKTLTIAEAREKAGLLRRLAQAGHDPVSERDRDRRKIPTFAEAVELAHAEFAKGWVPKHAAAFKSSLETHIVPTMGTARVDLIDHATVRDALAGIWTDKPVMARKLRVRVNQVLGFAKSNGWRTRELPDAKEVTKGLAKHSRASHFAALPYKAVPELVGDLLGQSDTPGRLALLFTILTAARSGEVRAATWDQIDLTEKTWFRPAGIMKMGVPHVIPLSDAALAVLERARPHSGGKGLIFPGQRSKAGPRALSDMTLTKALRTAGQDGVTVHGFRSSFRDWAAEQMPTVPAMVAEMALAHRVGTETERAYLRTDLQEQRRALMTAWSNFCTGAEAVDDLAAHRAKKAAQAG